MSERVSENRIRDVYDGMDVFTDDERAWCIKEADRCAEGSLDRKYLETLDDRTLAFETLGAMWDHARSQI